MPSIKKFIDAIKKILKLEIHNTKVIPTFDKYLKKIHDNLGVLDNVQNPIYAKYFIKLARERETVDFYAKYILQETIADQKLNAIREFMRTFGEKLKDTVNLYEKHKPDIIKEEQRLIYNLQLQLNHIGIQTTDQSLGIVDTSFIIAFDQTVLKKKRDNFEIVNKIPVFAPDLIVEELQRDTSLQFTGKEFMQQFVSLPLFSVKEEANEDESILNAWASTEKGRKEISDQGVDQARGYFRNTADFGIIRRALRSIEDEMQCLVFANDKDIQETLDALTKDNDDAKSRFVIIKCANGKLQKSVSKAA